METKKAFCSNCNQIKPIYYTITVNGADQHFCEACQQSQKAEFMQKLASGDPKATELMQRLLQILGGEK